MSQDKKLRLVPPPEPVDPRRAVDDEPPPSAEEIAEAEALRRAIDEGDEPLSDALRAANAPAPLSEPDHEALLARALGDPLAPPTRVEERDAARLAAELAGQVTGEGSESYRIARSLRAAHTPRAIDQVTHERILKKALGGEVVSTKRRFGARFAVVSSLFVAAAALAMFVTTQRASDKAPSSMARAPAVADNGYATPPPAATAAAAAPEAQAAAEATSEAKASRGRASEKAGGAKMAQNEPPRPGKGAPAARPAPKTDALDGQRPGEASRPAAAGPGDRATAMLGALIPSRSTDDLFDPGAKFPRTGGESARIDRIAMARESDLRQNRYAAWGVP